MTVKDQTSYSPLHDQSSDVAPQMSNEVTVQQFNLLHEFQQIPSHLNIPAEQLAVQFFFSIFHSPDDARVRTGYLDFFPSAFLNSSPDSIIYLSTISVACSAVGSLCGSPREKWLGDIYFYKAISAVRKALEDETRRENDETLIGILLLRIYEVCVSHLLPNSRCLRGPSQNVTSAEPFMAFNVHLLIQTHSGITSR